MNSRKCVLCLRVRCFVELSADVYIKLLRIISPSIARSSVQVPVALGLPVSPTRACCVVHTSRVVEGGVNDFHPNPTFPLRRIML